VKNNHFSDAALKQFTAAQSLLHECAKFERDTGFAVGKANELVSAAIVNRWLDREGYGWNVEIMTRPRGVDGILTGSKTGNAEFKSSKQGSASFEFKEHFPFADHACVVMTQFSEGTPISIFLAFGEQAMTTLARLLKADTERESFKRPEHNARLFSTRRERGALPDKPSTCLADNLRETSDDDRIIHIGAVEIQTLMA
jgi:hypothetical protein